MTTEHATTAQATQGRNEYGQFATGNRGGPGNPFARQVAALRTALINSVTPEDIQQVAGALVARAKEGNVQAIKLFFQYIIGKPQPAPEPDHLDIDEWNIYRATTPMKQESAPLISAGEPHFHVNCVRAVRPIATQLMRQQLNEIASETPEQRVAREDAEAAEVERRLNSPATLPEGIDDDPLPNGSSSPLPAGEGPGVRGFDRARGGMPPSPNGTKRPPREPQRRHQPSTNGDLR